MYFLSIIYYLIYTLFESVNDDNDAFLIIDAEVTN